MNRGKNTVKSELDNFFLDKLRGTEKKISNLQKYLSTLEKNYKIKKEPKIVLPLSIFKSDLTVFESVVKFLKEEYNLNYHEISGLVDRDERNIWPTYKRASIKHPKKIITTKSKVTIPIDIFSSKLSFLESIVFYLKENYHLKFSQIAQLLKRDARTIWTCYTRAKKKNE